MLTTRKGRGEPNEDEGEDEDEDDEDEDDEDEDDEFGGSSSPMSILCSLLELESGELVGGGGGGGGGPGLFFGLSCTGNPAHEKVKSR